MAQSNTDSCRSAASLMSMSQDNFNHTNHPVSRISSLPRKDRYTESDPFEACH
jgi:hypothetical protein